MATLPELVRARRKELGLTLEEVAEIVGVTSGALSHIEGGRRLPDPRNAMAIARALQLDPDELLTLLDEAHAERRARQAGWTIPSERRSNAGRSLPQEVASFRAMPIDALFAAGAGPADEPSPVAYAVYDSVPEWTSALVHSAVELSSPRDRARHSPASAERMRAAEELAEDASRAIRTLRGMLDDEDPAVARQARRMLLELGLRVPEKGAE
jgi:transcriptional regulator with XRE-family HTH domain